MIEIDENHRSFICSLIRCTKPFMVLELGYGSGLTTKTICYALQKNKRGNLVVVDNFLDWEFNKPDHFKVDGFKFEQLDEKEYLESTKDHFDIIICDADHNNTHNHIDYLLAILNRDGYLIFHDVTNPMFPNLKSIIDKLPNGFLFCSSSLESEQCERGLYIWQKR
jgi:predicted O-methyltransferase YrrM